MLELDFTEIMPRLVSIKAGEARYILHFDELKSVEIARAARWVNEADALGSVAEHAQDEAHDKRGIDITARLLHISYDEAERLGGPARYRLLAFLSLVSFQTRMYEPRTDKPSRSRSSSKAR